jgi:hypothetical protein
MDIDTDRDARGLFKNDFARRIDRVIDYFGEAEASASRRETPGSAGGGPLAAAAGWILPLD